MFNAPYILIQDTLLICVLRSHGLDCFPRLNMHGINISRYHKNKTPHEKELFRKTMSIAMKKIMHNVRVKFCANRTPAQKKEWSERQIKRNKNYWKTMTVEERRIQCEKIKLGQGRRIEKIRKIKVEDNLPRINTYSGVITESQMESL